MQELLKTFRWSDVVCDITLPMCAGNCALLYTLAFEYLEWLMLSALGNSPVHRMSGVRDVEWNWKAPPDLFNSSLKQYS